MQNDRPRRVCRRPPVRPSLHAFRRAGMRRDAARIGAGEKQPRAAERTHGQNRGSRRGTRARRDQRLPDVRRTEGANLEHASDADEYARESGSSGDAAIGAAAFRRLRIFTTLFLTNPFTKLFLEESWSTHV